MKSYFEILPIPAPQSMTESNLIFGNSTLSSLRNFYDPAISIWLKLPNPLRTPSYVAYAFY